MKKIFTLSLSLLAISFILKAQNEKAYFQQEVRYKINVALDDKKNDLNADETLEYINNSPDELTFIWFHIWPNAYKNNYTPLAKQLIASGNKKFYFASADERGYIDKLDFKVNGQSVKTEAGESIDICKLILNEPLKPGGKITITTPFHIHIPIGVFSRLGHIGQQYQITQWYPKPSVYDKYGWHPIPYLNQGEFYSEFGSYDVSITLPKNYVLGATGTMVNGDEETAWLYKKAEETKTIEKYNPRDTAFPASSSEMKTLRFTAQNVHDFAWFTDKRYHVLHDEVTLPHSKNKVDTWVMYTNMYGDLWKKGAKYVSDAVYYYSLWNGDYPYPHATAVDGALSAGGGMEYPMITVIGPANNDETLDRVIAHEVGHNWFYGILGSNERDHAWMDEGINSFNENRYMKTKYPPDSVKTSTKAKIGGLNVDLGKLIGAKGMDETVLFDLGYRFNAVQKKDQPVDLTSAEYTTVNYGTIVYGKTAVILAYLQAYLGTEMYDKCAQAYFEKWKFHHPYPPDIKKVYEEVSGKNLSWFFDTMIPTTKQVDYGICSAKKGSDGQYNVKVSNKGKIVSPFSISSIKDGKIVSTQWYDGFAGKNNINFSSNGDFDHLKIDAQNAIPDINRQNNTLKMKGLCKKAEPFNLHMMGLVHNPDKTQLFWMPVMGWNNYNKFMLGAVFYNNVIPEKKLEWQIMPMYGFGNKDLAGGAALHYNIHFNKIFQTVRIGGTVERYAYSNAGLDNLNFNKATPELYLEFRKKHLNSPLKQSIRIREAYILNELATADRA
ncbi:MAG TPA: M1 family metallopeptidase, partial [Bacteroidia bacterium]